MKRITIIYQEKLPRPNFPVQSVQDASHHASGHFIRLMGEVQSIANSLTRAGHACFFRRMSGADRAERGRTLRLPVSPLECLEEADILVVVRDLEIEEFDYVLESTLLGAGFPLVILDPLATKNEDQGFELGKRIAWCREGANVQAAVTALLQKMTP
jgi:hypothetical protein